MKAMFGDPDHLLLAPSAGLERPGAQVLDAGTGTGVWMIELASHFPTASFLGIDLDNRLFLSRPAVPPNVRVEKVNVVTELQAKIDGEGGEEAPWKDRFDLVHQRLMLAALTRAQWRETLRKYYDVLKPGGWIQCGEMDMIGHGEPGSAIRQGWDLGRALGQRVGIAFDIVTELAEVMKGAGFEDVHESRGRLYVADTFKEAPTAGRSDEERESLSVASLALRAVVAVSVKAKELGIVPAAEYDELIARVRQEYAEAPPDLYAGHRIVWGRKPAA
jgi:SAM-dependent methyltransferase